ncbi:MAG TPA: hypothetical protein VL854_05160 [Nitrososphaeraceae archaeon]|nr:hypothetical protein [Nitrososphaeraceae archaeon]
MANDFPEEISLAKKFAHLLTDSQLTFSILRKGKEALSFGYKTHPTLSQLITSADNIQIDSVKEAAKLKYDLHI